MERESIASVVIVDKAENECRTTRGDDSLVRDEEGLIQVGCCPGGPYTWYVVGVGGFESTVDFKLHRFDKANMIVVGRDISSDPDLNKSFVNAECRDFVFCRCSILKLIILGNFNFVLIGREVVGNYLLFVVVHENSIDACA